MDNIMEFPENEAIEDQALVWLIRLDGDKPLDAVEEHELEAWLARSPVHRESLKSLNTFWANSNVLNELAEPQSIMALCRRRLKAAIWPMTGFRQATIQATMAQVAMAAFMVVLALGVVVGSGIYPVDITKTNGLYLTAVGQQKTITLADTSQIELNTNSQIQVDYSEGFRNIRLLQGEVHFEVAKDPDKPFRVYAGNGRVQAVGTAFNVYLKDDDINVFVTEGRVALASTLPVVSADEPQDSAGAQELAEQNSAPDQLPSKLNDLYAKTELNILGAIAAGHGAILKKTAAELQGQGQLAQHQSVIKLVPIVVDNPQQQNPHLAWRQGLLIFSGESLEEVIAEVSRYTSVDIEIVNPELRGIEIGGQIQVGDTESMFKALEASFGLKINRLSYNRVQVVALTQL
jgi:transmembrane sensor